MEFKTIKSFDQYEVSDTGVVRNKKTGKELKQTIKCFGGYPTVMLYSKSLKKMCTRRVHRLVADAFIENPNSLPEVDHINHDKYDNNVSNLRWITKRDNLLNRDWCKKEVVMCDKKDNYLRTFKNTSEAAEYLNKESDVNYSSARVAICQVCQGYRPTAYKYKWYYLNNYRYINKDYSKAAKESFLEDCEELRNDNERI